MSPAVTAEKLNIKRVAVIGAGPGGLAAAKYLEAEKTFDTIQVFDQRAVAGGIWNHTPLNVVDDGFTVPRTQPTTLNDVPVWPSSASASASDPPSGPPSAPPQFVSPVYDQLETNIPHTLMSYSDAPFAADVPLFPRHEDVAAYLHACAARVAHLLCLATQVVSVRPVPRQPAADAASATLPCWELELLDLATRTRRTAAFDAVVVATGHYNDPFIPDIPGLAAFNARHPGAVSHSKFYRHPEQYRNKKVVVVGHSASGIDISAQIATVAQTPVVVSEKAAPATPVEGRAWARMKPQIVEFRPETRALRFEDGSVEADVDAVVFCTGYFYAFPFLHLEAAPGHPPVVTDGACARHLYEHLLYIPDPTLAFIGIPQRVVPLPLSEAQSAWLARVWAGRLPVPTTAAMRAWEAAMLADKGADGQPAKPIHNLAFPLDMAYINGLHARSVAAAPRPGRLAHGGAGHPPPYWDGEKAWVRERFPSIKLASRALGDKRAQVKTLAELGFTYVPEDAAKAANAAKEPPGVTDLAPDSIRAAPHQVAVQQ